MQDMPNSATATNLRTIEKLFQAFNKQDLDQIMDCFTDNGVYQDFRGPMPSGQVYSGKEMIRDCFASMFKQFPNFHSEDMLPMAMGGVGALEYTVVMPNNQGNKIKFCDVFEFDAQGLVTRKSTWMKSIV